MLNNKVLTKQETIELEETWRLKLKLSGFEDIEAADYRVHNKTKQLQFIRGRIRYKRYGGVEAFNRRKEEVFEYYRIIGLYAHHSPKGSEKLEGYREVLKEVAYLGSVSKAIKSIQSEVKYLTLQRFIKKTFPEMLEFVRKLDIEYD